MKAAFAKPNKLCFRKKEKKKPRGAVSMVCSEVQSRAIRSQNPPRGLHEEGNSASTKK